MERSSNIFKRLDWWSVLLYAMLASFGWINIYAAVYNDEHQSIFDISQLYGKQLIWMSVSVVLIIIIFIIDVSAYEFLAYPIYMLAILLLISVLFLGVNINGARSWFELGGIRFQPAEFTKVAAALALARFMSEYKFKISDIRNLIISCAIVFLPMAMIILQNDTGSALVYFAFIIVLYREGLSPIFLIVGFLFVLLFIAVLVSNVFYVFIGVVVMLFITFVVVYRDKRIIWTALISLFVIACLLLANKYLLNFNKIYMLGGFTILALLIFSYPAYIKRLKYYSIIAGIFISALGFSMSVEYIFQNILEKHQRKRINVVLGLEDDPKGFGYNVNQSKIAIGSGGVYGKGFLQGTQTKFDFVPEQETDFIFCTVGEEWGFLGSTAVIIVFAMLIIRVIIISERQRVKMHRIYGYSVASVLFFHVAVNIGMTIGVTPVIGIPLPFFSYGGSSFWSFTILLFILIRFDASRMERL